jgi:hypothetical protein
LSSLRWFLFASFDWLIAVIWLLCRAALIAWATLAIYYSNLPSAGMRLALAAAFAAFTIWAWSHGGFPSNPHMIATGDRKSR